MVKQLYNIQTSKISLRKGKIAKILLDIGAVNINTTNPFRYSSEIFSPIYTNCRILNSFPKERKIIIDLFIDYIEKVVGIEKIEVIAGTAASGISLATYVATRLKLPMVYVRSNLKNYGKEKQIEGELKDGSRVLLLTDILSTEKDIEISVNALKNKRCEIVCCLAIFNNNLGIIDSFLDKERINYHCLADLETLLTVAQDEDRISTHDIELVLNWVKNPYDWDKNRKHKLETFLSESEEKIAKLLLKAKAVTLNVKNPYELSSGLLSPIYIDCRILPSFPEEWNEIINAFVNIIVNEVGMQNVEIIGGTSTAGISHAAYLADRLDMPLIYIKSYSEIGEYLFSWDKIPGNDSDRLIEFLIQNFDVNLETYAKIEKSIGSRTINISDGKSSIYLILNNEKTKVNLIINGLRAGEIIAKIENDKLNVYNEERISKIEGDMKKNNKVIIIEDVVSTGKSLLESIRAVRDNGGVVDTCLSIFSYNTKEAEISFNKEKIKLISLTNLTSLLDVVSTQQYINTQEKEVIIDWIDNPFKWSMKLPLSKEIII